jgi:hypothetical protein
MSKLDRISALNPAESVVIDGAVGEALRRWREQEEGETRLADIAGPGSDRFPSGWWLLPALAGGMVVWALILRALFT